MHPFLNSQLANQHQTTLQREAEMVRLASQVNEHKHARRANRTVTFLPSSLKRTNVSSRQAVVLPEPVVQEVPLAEIGPALHATFTLLHEEGLISDYDLTFIEQFNETLKRELVHQVQCHTV